MALYPKRIEVDARRGRVLVDGVIFPYAMADRQAVAGVYELSKILSAMQQIKKEQEDANLKIGFINKKKERKAMEEAAEE